jgi:hypothetical protein
MCCIEGKAIGSGLEANGSEARQDSDQNVVKSPAPDLFGVLFLWESDSTPLAVVGRRKIMKRDVFTVVLIVVVVVGGAL